jgi:ornithine cyclodeaminase/alanine dehydrogenase-like protein (mu-crystallin family)
MKETLLLSGADVERLLTPEVCIAAVEEAFRQLGEGRVPPPGILGMHHGEGSFHVKAGFLTGKRAYFAAKLNANFPQNGSRHGLPTIQGAVLLSDAADGRPLAIMDSVSITALRTAAASAVAAKYLANPSCEALLICGCGGQAAAQVEAMLNVRHPARVYTYDLDPQKARSFAGALEAELPVQALPVTDLAAAVAASDLIITCTTARKYFVSHDMVRPGTFIAAVGADNENKQEIDPRLMARAMVVTDVTEQAAAIGDLHHAIDAGAMKREDVHAELCEVIAKRKPGRTAKEQIVVFDSTGTGLQDVAAAIAAYERAVEEGVGDAFQLTRRQAA